MMQEVRWVVEDHMKMQGNRIERSEVKRRITGDIQAEKGELQLARRRCVIHAE